MKRTVKKRNPLLLLYFGAACVFFFLSVAFSGTAVGQTVRKTQDPVILKSAVIKLFGIGPGTGAEGVVVVRDNVRGPDRLELLIEGLPPGKRIAVMLTRHAEPGKLPAQFIGEFTTNKRGVGGLSLRAEIVNAYATANQVVEDKLGEADDSTAGSLPFPAGGTANTIPLNWIRGYFVDISPHNVFGTDENTPGGAPAFLSASPLR